MLYTYAILTSAWSVTWSTVILPVLLSTPFTSTAVPLTNTLTSANLPASSFLSDTGVHATVNSVWVFVAVNCSTTLSEV